MQPVYLRQKLEVDSTLKGEIKALAYSGAPILNHGPFNNLIIDVKTLTVAKDKTPILRDHNPSLVAGHGVVSIEGPEVRINGSISKKAQVGQEIISLAEEGFEWEMSLGVFDGQIEEFEDKEFNGFKMSHGFVLKNGVLREVSVVALGADMNTNAQIFSKKQGENKMEITNELYLKLACACGGDKDTAPEELAEMAEKQKLGSEEDKAKVAALESELAEMKKSVADKEAEIAAIKEKEDAEMRASDLKSAADAKGLKLTAAKIAEASKSKEGHSLLMSVIADMEVIKKVDAKFAAKMDVSEGAKKATNKDEIRLAAHQLIKEGKAKDMIEAISLVEVK